MKKSFFNDEFDKKIMNYGWHRINSGSSRRQNYNDQFALYVKAVEIGTHQISSQNESPQNPCKIKVFGDSEKNGNGILFKDALNELDEQASDGVLKLNDDVVCLLNSCLLNTTLIRDGVSVGVNNNCYVDECVSSSYFVKDMRADSKNSLCIYCDCCWVEYPSNVISYHYSVCCGKCILCFVFFLFKDVVSCLPVNIMLGRIFDFLSLLRINREKVTSYKYISRLDDKGKPVVETSPKRYIALSNCKYAFINNEASNTLYSDVKNDKRVNASNIVTENNYDEAPLYDVTLIGFHFMNFLTALRSNGKYDIDILEKCSLSESEHCVFSDRNTRLCFNSVTDNGWKYLYYISLSIRDSMQYNCCEASSVFDYGNYVGIPIENFSETEFGEKFEKCLPKVLYKDAGLFLEYSSKRTISNLMYMSYIWGFNLSIPLSITSAASKTAKHKIAQNMCITNEKEFLPFYAGTKLFKGKTATTEQNKYFRNSTYIPIDNNCELLQRYASYAYRGGYNGCFSVDSHHNIPTYDLDICGAYPTAMGLIPAIRWEDCICNRIINRKLCIDDFMVDGEISPVAPIFACVTYKFPESCKFPCLPRYDEDDNEAPCYPFEDQKGIYACGPELYLALKMGAEIFAKDGVKGSILKDENGNTVFPYRTMMSELIQARTRADKGSLDEKLLKKCANMMYGKVSQNVSGMYSKTKASGSQSKESVISNNASASLITAFVRSVLFAALNEIDVNGYHVYSATTDGLITDMPFEEFLKLNLFGFNELLRISRRELTQEPYPEIWSIKHEQDDLLNLLTRGNASSIVSNSQLGIRGGVFAKANVSIRYPNEPKASQNNRDAFINDAVTRSGPVESESTSYPSLKKYKEGVPYVRSKNIRHISLDFDMKRKPIRNSLKAEYRVIEGEQYEVAHIDTEPYLNSDEFIMYRSVAKSMKCLRTVEEWEQFFKKIEKKAKKRPFMLKGQNSAKY